MFVAAKIRVSQVRIGLETSGCGLLNLPSSYQWKQVRLDAGIANVFNRCYQSPLGGAYVGQLPMTCGTWVPATGRSLYAGLNVQC